MLTDDFVSKSKHVKQSLCSCSCKRMGINQSINQSISQSVSQFICSRECGICAGGGRGMEDGGFQLSAGDQRSVRYAPRSVACRCEFQLRYRPTELCSISIVSSLIGLLGRPIIQLWTASGEMTKSIAPRFAHIARGRKFFSPETLIFP